MNSIPIREMIKNAVGDLGGKASYKQIIEWITTKYGDVNHNTIKTQTMACSVNRTSRVHLPECGKPRGFDSRYDFLYQTESGQVELYDPQKHGSWEIKEQDGKARIAHNGKIISSSDEDEFYFVEKDFESFTGVKEDHANLFSKFKDLESILKNNLGDSFKDSNSNVGNYWKRGKKNTYKNFQWLGFDRKNTSGHNIFQVSINSPVNLSVMIWIDSSSKNEFKELVSEKINGNHVKFIELLKTLPPFYYIGIQKRDEKPNEIQVGDGISSEFIETIKNNFEKNDHHFYIASHKSTLLNRLHVHLISKCEELMKQGLLKSYVLHAENSSSIRGKLLMQHQMLNDAMLKPKFFCEFDELEYDSNENRVILQALTIVERTSDNVDVRMKAMDLAQKLSGVVEKTTISGPERQRMMQSYSRQNLRYRDIHLVCEQIIQESGIEDIYKGDDSYVVPVFYDMNELFETFVQNIFKINRKGVETQYSEKAWAGKGDLGPRRMKPDITIWEQTSTGKVCKQIIDVKYKIKDISSGDLYQLGFYMHEFEKRNPNEESISHAFAITPDFDNAGSGSYTSLTGKKVFVKRIDVKDCLEIIKSQDMDKWNKLEEKASKWIEPII